MYYRGPIDYKESRNFSNNDECVWVVYPPGAAGDLLSVIINYHYLQTGSKFFGINDRGQIVFSPTDGKISNMKYKQNKLLDICDQQLIHDVNWEIGKNTLSYNMLDMVLFSNHGYKDRAVENILWFFKKSKVVRILPQNKKEAEIIFCLSMFKNQYKKLAIDSDVVEQIEYKKYETNLKNERIFEVKFNELLEKNKFENMYTRLIKYLNLPCKLIRFDFIELWLSKQDQTIIKNLKLL